MEPTNQGEAAKLSQGMQIDEGKIQEHLGAVGSQHGGRDVERHAGCRNRWSFPSRAVRTDRGAERSRAGSYERPASRRSQSASQAIMSGNASSSFRSHIAASSRRFSAVSLSSGWSLLSTDSGTCCDAPKTNEARFEGMKLDC